VLQTTATKYWPQQDLGRGAQGEQRHGREVDKGMGPEGRQKAADRTSGPARRTTLATRSGMEQILGPAAAALARQGFWPVLSGFPGAPSPCARWALPMPSSFSPGSPRWGERFYCCCFVLPGRCKRLPSALQNHASWSGSGEDPAWAAIHGCSWATWLFGLGRLETLGELSL
jgi:hypothetical protein